MGVHRREWRLRLSAAVGLREHRQERSGSSSQPPPLPIPSLSLISHTLLFLSLFAACNRLLTPLPLLKSFLYCSLVLSVIPPSLLSHIMFPNSGDLDSERCVVFGQPTDIWDDWKSQKGKDPLSHTHSHRRTHSKSGLKWLRRDVCVVSYVIRTHTQHANAHNHVTTPVS